jgi:hypothetical protein
MNTWGDRAALHDGREGPALDQGGADLEGHLGAGAGVRASGDAHQLRVRELVEAEPVEFPSDPEVLDAPEGQVRRALDRGVEPTTPTSSRSAT